MGSGLLSLAILIGLFGSAILFNLVRLHFSLRAMLYALTLSALTLGLISAIVRSAK
jgi:hypothetical protein